MLTPSDVDPGDALAAGEVHGDWSLGFFGSICERFLETPDPGSAIPLAFREQQITGPVAVIQAVSVHPPDGAASLMRHARRLVHDCATIEHETSRWSLAIVESGFAGAESMMVQVTPLGVGGVGTHLYALIRQGDAVTEIRFEHSTAAQRRSIAAAAAGRLCAATTTC